MDKIITKLVINIILINFLINIESQNKYTFMCIATEVERSGACGKSFLSNVLPLLVNRDP